MRQILEAIPGAALPDPVGESESLGGAIDPVDDNDLLRPVAEEELFRVGARGTLALVATPALAKHLVWSFGPLHSALPFPMLLRVELDGDVLVTVEPEFGFLHQGLEKMAEQLPLERGFDIAARVHPLAPVAHELAHALVLERLFGVEDKVPERAQLWRTIALELHRVHEHTLMLASPHITTSARMRETWLTCARTAAGLLDVLMRPGTFRRAGGLAAAVHDDEADRLARALIPLRGALMEAAAHLQEHSALDAHLEGLGRVHATEAIALGLTGPALRACGIADDARVTEQPFGYSRVSVSPVIDMQGAEGGGDARARMRVRLQETLASTIIVERALALLPACDAAVAIDLDLRAPPAGVASASLELPSGELSLTVVSRGDARPTRWRMRGPSCALSEALSAFLLDNRIDDVIPVIASLGLVGTEIDL